MLESFPAENRSSARPSTCSLVTHGRYTDPTVLGEDRSTFRHMPNLWRSRRRAGRASTTYAVASGEYRHLKPIARNGVRQKKWRVQGD